MISLITDRDLGYLHLGHLDLVTQYADRPTLQVPAHEHLAGAYVPEAAGQPTARTAFQTVTLRRERFYSAHALAHAVYLHVVPSEELHLLRLVHSYKERPQGVLRHALKAHVRNLHKEYAEASREMVTAEERHQGTVLEAMHTLRQARTQYARANKAWLEAIAACDEEARRCS